MPGTVTLFEHTDFGGRALWLGIDNFAESALHSLKGTALHDRVSSLRWDLPDDVVVVLYEHTNGTGRTYLVPSGRGSDASTHDDNFKDCASSWRWTRRGVASSVGEAFGWIGTQGRAAAFDPAGIDLGSGHLQGVGLIDHATLAMSTSGDAAHVLIVEWPDRVSGRARFASPRSRSAPGR